MRPYLLVMSMTAISACTKVADVFVCSEDSQCRIEQQEGRCEPSGFCSLPASDCPSQFRYDRSAVAALAGQCVLEVDCNAPFMPSGAVATGRCVEGAPPVIDGWLDEWPMELFTTRVTHAEVIANGGRATGTWSTDEVANDASLSAAIAWRWDARYLYVAARITDQELVGTSSKVYENDSFELFLDGLYGNGNVAPELGGAYAEDDLQLLIDWNGVRNMARGRGSIGNINEVLTDTKPSAAGWTVEIAVPFSILGEVPVIPGREIGIDIVVSDRASPPTTDDPVLVWKQTAPDPSPCGDCTTVCKPACSTLHFVPLQLGGS